MNKNIMIIWTIIVVTILACIFVIGIKYKQQYPYIKYKNNLKEQSKKYIEKESAIQPDKNINIIITTEELLEKKYIKTTKVKDKNCTGTITVSYDKKYEYEIKVKCK